MTNNKQLLGFLNALKVKNDKIGKELAGLLRPIGEIRAACVCTDEIINNLIHNIEN